MKKRLEKSWMMPLWRTSLENKIWQFHINTKVFRKLFFVAQCYLLKSTIFLAQAYSKTCFYHILGCLPSKVCRYWNNFTLRPKLPDWGEWGAWTGIFKKCSRCDSFCGVMSKCKLTLLGDKTNCSKFTKSTLYLFL